MSEIEKLIFKKQDILDEMKRLQTVIETEHMLDVVQLKTGKSFGELALIKNKPRAATIKCNEDCHFAIMSKSDY